MPKLSASSQARINSAVPPLKTLFNACAADPKCPPFQVLDARRGRKAQEQAFAKGNTRAHFGQSPHNYSPPVALDVTPVPLDWNDIAAFNRLGNFVLAKAKALGLNITWGKTFKGLADYPHFEAAPWRTWAAKSKLYEG